jgi:acetoin utilization deacetylase AcuC-like enzyme
LDFLSTGWTRWDALGEEGQDPVSTKTVNLVVKDIHSTSSGTSTLPLIPGNFALPRNDPYQRPSTNVMGQVGYYCTDTCTPIFAELLEELLWDLETILMAVNMATVINEDSSSSTLSSSTPLLYALCTHPGHHSTQDAFGGYCYLNHSALAARLMQERLQQQQSPKSGPPKVAVLDVDYHCGNGSASIFYDDPSVLVVSIHCHPDWDYPFHSGFHDERGVKEGVGATLHLPLLPGTTWEDSYQPALERAMKEIQSFGAQGLVVSLGLDTYAGDPCAVRRAGFLLKGDDYKEMGKLIGKYARDDTCRRIPLVVVQEGGYKMDKVPLAVSDVLLALASSLES